MTTKSIQKAIAYLKGCYEADNRELAVFNFRDKGVGHHLPLENSELLTGGLTYLPVRDEYATALQSELLEYQFEKSLFLSIFFLTGKIQLGGRNKKVLAPLFMVPMELIRDDDGFSLVPDFSGVAVNPAFFRCINAVEVDDTDTIAEISAIVNGTPLGFDQVAKIQRVIEERYPNVDTNELLLFPRLTRTVPSKVNSPFKILSMAEMGVLRRSGNTVNVIKELTELENKSELSVPLRNLIVHRPVFPEYQRNHKNDFPVVPSALNQSQINAIQNSKSYDTSIIIGPPGTGKSYTIAALAIDAMYHGKSVLVASSSDQAVDVVKNKIEQAFSLNDICIRLGGKGDYKNELKHRIENLLNNIGAEQIAEDVVNYKRNKVIKILAQIGKLEKAYRKGTEKATKKGERLANSSYKIISHFWHSIESLSISGRVPVWKILLELESLYPQKYHALTDLIQFTYKKELNKGVHYKGRELRAFSKAVRSRTIKRRLERFEKIDFNALKGMFPVWLTNLSEIGMVLPMKPDLFDLVIIDEASQCDMARALPLIQRGKHAVICGDVKQLRHVSFLSPKKADFIAQKLELSRENQDVFDYKKKSILDLALSRVEDQRSITFLDEHFRSDPEIIAFSNQKFYGGHLKIMTESPFTRKERALNIIRSHGKRVNGTNIKEAEQILKEILEVIARQNEIQADLKSTLGVLSPFRDQVNYLHDFLYQKLPSNAYTEHDILVGTAHSFQGEERDIMLLSFAVDNDSHPTAIRHLNRDDVLNVSITRAREKQLLFLSRDLHRFPKDSLMAQYLESAETGYRSQLSEGDRIHDEFSKEVYNHLETLNLEEIWTDYTLSGIRFDLVIKQRNHVLGIDLIGYPGAFDEVVELDRIKLFKRAGHRVFPIPYNHWLYDRDNLLTELDAFIQASVQ